MSIEHMIIHANQAELNGFEHLAAALRVLIAKRMSEGDSK